MKKILFFFILVIFSGCIKEVKPYQKNILAKQSMQESVNNSLNSFEEHIYFSKEASKASSNIKGGGCGCN